MLKEVTQKRGRVGCLQVDECTRIGGVSGFCRPSFGDAELTKQNLLQLFWRGQVYLATNFRVRGCSERSNSLGQLRGQHSQLRSINGNPAQFHVSKHSNQRNLHLRQETTGCLRQSREHNRRQPYAIPGVSRRTNIAVVLRNKLRGIGLGHVLTKIVPHELTERRTRLLWVQHASSKLHIKHKPLTREAAATQCLELRLRVCHDLRSIAAQPAFKREQIGVASGPRKLNGLVTARDTGTYHLAVKPLEFEAKPGRRRGSYPREPVGKGRPDHDERGRNRWRGWRPPPPPPGTPHPCPPPPRGTEPPSHPR